MESLSSAENQEEEVNLQYSKYFDFSFGFFKMKLVSTLFSIWIILQNIHVEVHLILNESHGGRDDIEWLDNCARVSTSMGVFCKAYLDSGYNCISFAKWRNILAEFCSVSESIDVSRSVCPSLKDHWWYISLNDAHLL